VSCSSSIVNATTSPSTSRTGPSPIGSESTSPFVGWPFGKVCEIPTSRRTSASFSTTTPDFLYWLGAAAISGAVIVGINSTYRGDELLRLIDHSDCQVVVTSEVYGGLLDDAGLAMDPRRVPPH